MRVGIVSGNGRLPFVATEIAKAQNIEVFVCAIEGETDKSIESVAHCVKWVKLGELKKLSQFFLSNQVKDICFVGKITKTSLFSGSVWPDLDMIMLFAKMKDRKDDTILGSICGYLNNKELNVIDSTTYLGDSLPGEGLLTKKKLSKKEDADVSFGWELAKGIAGLDIGQSVIVKDQAILAAEAIEGTDEAIKRGGALGRDGVVVVKVAKPDQDMRFDVPTIGPQTIQSMLDVKARVIAFEAGKTILVDRDDVISLADKNGISIIGV